MHILRNFKNDWNANTRLHSCFHQIFYQYHSLKETSMQFNLVLCR